MGRGASLSLYGMYRWNDSLFDDMSFPEDFDNETKEIFVGNLVMECAELEIIYSDWDFLKKAIDLWSAKELPTWNRLYAAMCIEYNPIENYNRTEDITETNSGSITHSGKDTNQASGKDTNQASGSDVNQASGNDSDAHTGTDTTAGSGTDTDTISKTSFDNNTFANLQKTAMQKGSSQTTTHNTTITHTNGRRDELTHGKKDELTYGKKDELTYGHVITDTTGKRTTGNISGNIGVTTSQQMLQQELDIVPKINTINIMIESFKNRFCIQVY